MSSPPDAHDELVSDADFDDAPDEGVTAKSVLSRVDPAMLTNPIVVRSLAGVVIAIAIVLWPERTDQILARLVGAGAVAFGAITLWSEVRSRSRRWLTVALAVGGIGIGASLLAAPASRSPIMLGRGLGVTAVFLALRLVVDLARRRPESRFYAAMQALFLGSSGALLLAFPTTVLTMVIVTFGLGWALIGVIAIATSLDPKTPAVWGYADATQMVVRWLDERPKDVDDRRVLYAKILYDGPMTSRRVSRFFTLMAFASVIAATGVVADSTATVIGAMLIAPLMTPLMGMSISLVMGWPVRLARSAMIAGAGITLAIAIGYIIGRVAPAVVDVATNTQIVARTSPTTLDLIIAVAAGAAGAYGLSRPDVSDSLPGVAIAISLVPPLTVVGIAASQGAWVDASGALLLFATNMIAILLVGGVVFVVTGVTPLRRLAENQHRVRTSIASVATLGLIVVGALLLNGAQLAVDLGRTSQVESVAENWIEDYPAHNLVEVGIAGDRVTAVVLGPSTNPPDAQALAAQMADELGRAVEADVRLIVEERTSATAEPSPGSG